MAEKQSMAVRKSARELQWVLSAPFYRFCYLDIAHQVDKDLFVYLGDRLAGAHIADCGSGPGIVTAKFIRCGAAVVYAIDASPGMLRQVKQRLPDAVRGGQVQLVSGRFGTELFTRLSHLIPENRKLDLVLFKRSLYHPPDQAAAILRMAAELLAPEGKLVVIHPEQSLSRYAFASGMRPAPHTLYHLFNRLTSRLAHHLGIGQYTLYTRPGLHDLLRLALPGFTLEWIGSRQTAYNLIAASKLPFTGQP